MKSRFDSEIERLMNRHLRSGAKAARRVEVERMKLFVLWASLHFPDIKSLQNLGKAHLKAFFAAKTGELSIKTLYDYRRALRKLWIALGRPPVAMLERKGQN